MSKLDLRSKNLGALAIAVVADTLASAFAWTAGWLGSHGQRALVVKHRNPSTGVSPRAWKNLLCQHLYAKQLSGFPFNLRLFSRAGKCRGGPIFCGTDGDPHAPDGDKPEHGAITQRQMTSNNGGWR